MPASLSVILPVHNEEANLKAVYAELKAELDKLGRPYEIIFVDDGSTDRSYQLLTDFVRSDASVRVVKLLKQSGQSNAMAAGIEHAKGAHLVTMDSDGQHDPRDIAKLLKPLDAGYHVVCGWRTKRQSADSYFGKTLPSKLSNWLVNRLSGVELRDSVGGMKAFDRRVPQTIAIFGDLHRYLPVLAAWKGFRIAEVPISVRRRRAGTTNYTWRRLFRGMWDLILVSFFISRSNRPSAIFAPPGLLALLTGIGMGVYLAVEKFGRGMHITQEHFLMLIAAVLLVLVGLILLVAGFIADMIRYETIARGERKAYIVDHVVQAKAEEPKPSS